MLAILALRRLRQKDGDVKDLSRKQRKNSDAQHYKLYKLLFI
jgi:hypothetical protein